jgi:hypothetical protein
VLAVATTGMGSGAISSAPAGIACGASCAASFDRGTAVTLTAAAAAGSAFTGWQGACAGTGACVVTMGADQAVTARFALRTCETPGGRLVSGEYIVATDTYVNTQAGPPAHPIPDGQFTECAMLDAGTTAGLWTSWSWSWPRPTEAAEMITRATPSIIYGFKPWDPQSTTASLPARVTQIASLRVDAEVQQTVGAGTSAMFGVIGYLTTADHKTGGDPLPFRKRLLIYRNVYPAYTPWAPVATQIPIDGLEWDLQVTDYYVEYTPHADMDVPATELHVDVAHFLADALARGVIDPATYLSSVETAEILQWGEGAVTLDDYQVQFQATPPVVHDRPATSSLRVVYAPGPDGLYGTADDAVVGYDQVYFQAGGDSSHDAWYFGAAPAGPDGLWFTADDVPAGYWTQPGSTYGWSIHEPGPDGVWFTADDPIYDWEQFGTSAGGQATNVLYDGPGPDGQWFTGDDVIEGYYLRSLDANGAETRRLTYVGPGPDGSWFTADDELSGGGYWTAEYSLGNTRWASWDRQVSYVGPGPDGVWLTADDAIGSCRAHIFAEDSEYWTTETTTAPGEDGACFTADDPVIGFAGATNTY